MPFTPFHMGPGVLAKALLQGGFSLLVFGWTQMVMDLQPLAAILTSANRLHGFSHTYAGSTVIAVFAALTGRPLSQRAFALMSDAHLRAAVLRRPLRMMLLMVCGKSVPGAGPRGVTVSWRAAFLSAFLGAYSHVLLDSIMHADIEPLSPFFLSNGLLGLVSIETLHWICLYAGLGGAGLYLAARCLRPRPNGYCRPNKGESR